MSLGTCNEGERRFTHMGRQCMLAASKSSRCPITQRLSVAPAMQMSGLGCRAEARSAVEVMVFKVQIPEQRWRPHLGTYYGSGSQARNSGANGAGTALQGSLLHTQAETCCVDWPEKNESQWEMGWRLTYEGKCSLWHHFHRHHCHGLPCASE